MSWNRRHFAVSQVKMLSAYDLSPASMLSIQVNLEVLWKVGEQKKKLRKEILLAGEPFAAEVKQLITVRRWESVNLPFSVLHAGSCEVLIHLQGEAIFLDTPEGRHSSWSDTLYLTHQTAGGTPPEHRCRCRY